MKAAFYCAAFLFAICGAPQDTACIGIVLAMRPGATLVEFASSCFRKADFLLPQGERQAAGDTWQGVIQDFVGPAPDETAPSLERVMCAQRGELFAKLTLYTSAECAQRQASLHEEIFKSLHLAHVRFGKMSS